MFDFLLIALIAVVTWLVASDGPWGAAITFVSVLLSGLFAMNYFEPLANFLGTSVQGSWEWQNRWDIIALLGLFSAGVFGLRFLGEFLLPTYAVLDSRVYEGARWGFSLLTGYVVTAIIVTSLHVAPLPREFLGFSPEQKCLFSIGPDRQWLAFTQYVSEFSLSRNRGDGLPEVFDGARFPAIPGRTDPNEIWSSFPIKYAARRQAYASGGEAPPVSTGNVPTSAAPGPGGHRPGRGTGGF
jgi:hypothetical protein